MLRHETMHLQVLMAMLGSVSCLINPLSDMPILGSSNSTANKDMISKI